MGSSSHPTRSISFPSRSNPNSLKIEETVNKLKSYTLISSTSTSTCGSLGAETIQLGLLHLVELYSHVQELMLSPSTRQALLCHDQGKLVEEALDTSVGLLDTCTSARDIVLRLKEQVWDLQSALRRKGCSSIESELSIYMGFRKKVGKDVARCLKVLKQAEGGLGAPLVDLDPYLAMVIMVLREVYGVTVGVFRSLFMFLTMPTKSSGWSLLSRLVTKRKLGVCSNINEVARVDLALNLDDSNVDVEVLRGRLQALDSSVRVIEEELECLFKCLVEYRVSLLNVLTR